MRASRETELVERFPLHVVGAWLGNSAIVAAKHYLQVTEGHFDRATASPDADSDAPTTHSPTQQAAAKDGTDS